MSYTKIYSFDKEGNATLAAEIQNSWSGAMAIWGILEGQHLPPYIPDFVKGCNWYRDGMTIETISAILGYTPTRCCSLFESKNPMQEIWDLADDKRLSEHERIALFTTFDKILVKKENIPNVIEAFRNFGGETSLPEQVDELEKLIKDDNCIAIGWNQTSVNSDTWENYSYDEATDERIPYNCLNQKEHYWIFDVISDEVQENDV